MTLHHLYMVITSYFSKDLSVVTKDFKSFYLLMFYVLFHIYRSQHSKMQQYFPLIKTKQNFCVLVNMIYLLVYFSLQIYSFSSKY